MGTISAVIITQNEESNIKRCLDSIAWVDEIIVVDSQSTDNTPKIAAGFGAKVYDIEWCGFGPAKGFAVERATCDWILSIDADEELTEELAAEIKGVAESSDSLHGYEIPRMTNFLGKWIKHSRWYPDYVLRLFRRESGRFTDSLIHEKVIVEGDVGRLKNQLLHYSYPDIDTYFVKFEKYTSLKARELYKDGKRFNIGGFVVKPLAAFCRHYITGLGFMDGFEGFLIALFSAFGVVTRCVKLRSLEKADRQ